MFNYHETVVRYLKEMQNWKEIMDSPKMKSRCICNKCFYLDGAIPVGARGLLFVQESELALLMEPYILPRVKLVSVINKVSN